MQSEHLRCFKTENSYLFFLQNTAWCGVTWSPKIFKRGKYYVIKYENIYMKNMKMKLLASPLSLSYGGLHRSFLQQVSWYWMPQPSLSALSFGGKSPGSEQLLFAYQKDEEDYIQTSLLYVYCVYIIYIYPLDQNCVCCSVSAAPHGYVFHICLRFDFNEHSVSVLCGWHRTAYTVWVQRILSKIALRWRRGDKLLNKVVIFVSLHTKSILVTS